MADESRWRYVVTDLNGGMATPGTGMLTDTSNKHFTYNINSARTAQCSINLDHPSVDYLFNNDCLLKVYRRNRFGSYSLFLVGDVVSVEETASGDTGAVTISAADPFYRLQHRALGVTNDSLGRGVPYMYGLLSDQVTPSPFEIGLALLLTLNLLNAFNYSGVAVGSSTGVINSSFGPTYSVYFGDVIQQSCAVLGGPDFSIVPHEPTGTWPNVTIGTMNFYSHLGTLNPYTAAVFEYGIGKHNLLGYQRLKTKANIANNVLSLPSGFPTVVTAGDHTIQEFDPTSVAAITEFDYILTGDNIVDKPMRTLLALETLAVLKQAQQQITFTPSVDCDVEFGTDYGMGDLVQARAYNKETNTLRYNGLSRVYGVDIQVDMNDVETTALTLIPA